MPAPQVRISSPTSSLLSRLYWHTPRRSHPRLCRVEGAAARFRAKIPPVSSSWRNNAHFLHHFFFFPPLCPQLRNGPEMGGTGAIGRCRRCQSASWPCLRVGDWRSPPPPADKSWRRQRRDRAFTEPVPGRGEKTQRGEKPLRKGEKNPSGEAAGGGKAAGGTPKPRKTPKGSQEGKIPVLPGGLRHPAVFFWGKKRRF